MLQGQQQGQQAVCGSNQCVLCVVVCVVPLTVMIGLHWVAFQGQQQGQQGVQAATSQLKTLVRTSSHHALLSHSSVTLLQAALPGDRRFWQLVRLNTGHTDPAHRAAGPGWEFVWQLSLQTSGCWLVDDIVRVEASTQ